MKKLVLTLAMVAAFAGSSVSVANAVRNYDSEHKPCHATKSNGGRCDCRDCRGNNWGNTYCTRCGHSTSMHY